MTGESRVDERVYRALKHDITHLEFRPGERLIVHADLSVRLHDWERIQKTRRDHNGILDAVNHGDIDEAMNRVELYITASQQTIAELGGRALQKAYLETSAGSSVE